MLADHYATLGVPPTAGAADIRTAYLALLREYHPDRNPDPAAIERSQAIIAAFKVLGDFDRRNHYDWDRRREREAAQAAVARSPRIGSKAMAAVAIGLAGAAAWALVPALTPRPATPRPAEIAPQVAAARDLPPEAKPIPRREVKRLATRDVLPAPAKVPVKAEEDRPVPEVRPPVPPVKLAKAVPPKAAAKRAPAVPVKVAESKPAKPRAIAKPPAPPANQIKVAGRPVRPVARPDIDLGSLDQFVMNFYGQSWRFGDAPKRAALARSRADFVVRRGGCAADACKRDAYLKLMRDVSSIVESKPPAIR